jgi:hypothetical protein
MSGKVRTITAPWNQIGIRSIDSPIDNSIVRINGTSGNLMQGSSVVIDDSGNVSTPGSINKVTITAPASSATLTIANGKTLTCNNSMTLVGADSTVVNLPTNYGSAIHPRVRPGFNWTVHGGTSFSGRSVAYGNGAFIAIEYDGTCWKSTDGQNWNIVGSIPGVTSVEEVCFGAGLFVAVNYSGSNRIAVSSDGINWTITYTGGVNLFSVTYGKGMFVASREDSGVGGILYSRDGYSWNISTYASSNSWIRVRYVNDQFIAVGFNSMVCITSPDGITWTSRSLPTTHFWYSIAYGNGIYVAIAENSRLATSTDGITWTDRGGSYPSGMRAIYFLDGMFIILTISTTTVYVSYDGYTLVPGSSQDFGSTGAGHAIAYSDDILVTVSAGGGDRFAYSGIKRIQQVDDKYLVRSVNASTDNALARFDTSSGNLIQNSSVTLTDGGTLTGITGINTITATEVGHLTGVTSTIQSQFNAITGGGSGDITPVASSGTNMTNGFNWIPANSGPPTGTPPSRAGLVPMYYDTTNNQFYIYNGSWRQVGVV